MNERTDDPLLRSARSEAVWVLIIGCCAAAYSLGFCFWFGYGRAGGDLQFVLGFPDWVFWGIIVPWCICLVLSLWFALFFMTDDELNELDPASNGTTGREESRSG